MKSMQDILAALNEPKQAIPQITSVSENANPLADQYLREFTELLEAPVNAPTSTAIPSQTANTAPTATTTQPNTQNAAQPATQQKTPQQSAQELAGTQKALDALKKHTPIAPNALDKASTDQMKTITPVIQNITKNPQLNTQLQSLIKKAQV